MQGMMFAAAARDKEGHGMGVIREKGMSLKDEPDEGNPQAPTQGSLRQGAVGVGLCCGCVPGPWSSVTADLGSTHAASEVLVHHTLLWASP